jgi:hypothetical protein
MTALPEIKSRFVVVPRQNLMNLFVDRGEIFLYIFVDINRFDIKFI